MVISSSTSSSTLIYAWYVCFRICGIIVCFSAPKVEIQIREVSSADVRLSVYDYCHLVAWAVYYILNFDLKSRMWFPSPLIPAFNVTPREIFKSGECVCVESVGRSGCLLNTKTLWNFRVFPLSSLGLYILWALGGRGLFGTVYTGSAVTPCLYIYPLLFYLL